MDREAYFRETCCKMFLSLPSSNTSLCIMAKFQHCNCSLVVHLCKCVVMQFCNANLKCLYVTEPLLCRSVPKRLLKWSYTQCADEASVAIAQRLCVEAFGSLV